MFFYHPLTFTIQNASKKLLLNSLLGHTVSSTAKPSMARQRIMEEERVRAVEAYRHLKKQKQQQHEARTAGLEKLKNLQWRWRLSSSVKFRNWEGAQDNRIWTVCVHWWTDMPAGEFGKMSLTTVRQTFASTGSQCKVSSYRHAPLSITSKLRGHRTFRTSLIKYIQTGDLLSSYPCNHVECPVVYTLFLINASLGKQVWQFLWFGRQ